MKYIDIRQLTLIGQVTCKQQYLSIQKYANCVTSDKVATDINSSNKR